MDSTEPLSSDAKRLWRVLLSHAAAPPTVPSITTTMLLTEVGDSVDRYTAAINNLLNCRAVLHPDDNSLMKLSQFKKVSGVYALLVYSASDKAYLRVLTPSEVQQSAIAELELINRELNYPADALIARSYKFQVGQLRVADLADYREAASKLNESGLAVVRGFTLNQITSCNDISPEAALREYHNLAYSKLAEERRIAAAIYVARWDLERQNRVDQLNARAAYLNGLSDNIEQFEKERRAYRREHISERVRREVWQRDGGRCVECGSQYDLEYDHIIAVVNGGATTARNLRLLCQRCNRSKGASI